MHKKHSNLKYKSIKSFMLASIMMFAATACGGNSVIPNNKPDDPHNEIEHKDHEDPEKIELIFARGHLHGKFGFHQNPDYKEVKYLKTVNRFTFTNVKGKGFVLTNDSPQKLIVCASEKKAEGSESLYGLWINYYNGKGELINSEFTTNGQDRIHQHFFIPKNVKPNGFGKKEADDNNPSKMFGYVYCDSDPWNGSIKEKTAKYIGDVNPIGMKGQFKFYKEHKLFDLEIRLMHASGSKFGDDGKASPYYKPTGKQITRDHWDVIVRLPVEVMYLQKYYGIDKDENSYDVETVQLTDFEEWEQLTLKETAAAYGADWRDILKDFRAMMLSDSDSESGSLVF